MLDVTSKQSLPAPTSAHIVSVKSAGSEGKYGIPRGRYSCRRKSGRFLGVPKGADQIRVYHPYGYFQDESVFLPEAKEAFDAVRPVAHQIICVSNDEIG